MPDWLSNTDLKLVAMCEQWKDAFEGNEELAALHINADDCAVMLEKIKRFLEAWKKFVAVDSSSNRTEKNVKKKDAQAAMRYFAGANLRYNMHISVAMREHLGIVIRDTVRTNHGCPKSQPITMLELTGRHFEHRVKALQREGRITSKPADAYGVRYGWKVSEEKPATGEDLTKTRFSRRTDITVIFTEADKGKTIWYATCYENSKGEAGPWSPVVEAHVW